MDQKHGATASVRGNAAHYERLLTEQESSGRSLRAFARERGLSPWTLYGWRAKLGRSRRRARTEAAQEEPGFVAVHRRIRFGEKLREGLRVGVPRSTAWAARTSGAPRPSTSMSSPGSDAVIRTAIGRSCRRSCSITFRSIP